MLKISWKDEERLKITINVIIKTETMTNTKAERSFINNEFQ